MSDRGKRGTAEETSEDCADGSRDLNGGDMWGGATRVPGPKELEGLTGTSLPLNGVPMGATPLGFLMRRNKKGRSRDGLFPINTYHHVHTSSIYSPLYHAYLWQHFRRYWRSWDHHKIRPSRPSA